MQTLYFPYYLPTVVGRVMKPQERLRWRFRQRSAKKEKKENNAEGGYPVVHIFGNRR